VLSTAEFQVEDVFAVSFLRRTYCATPEAWSTTSLALSIWTFADVPDVEPTNNAAERGLRAAVIYRKLSFGSRSQGGERTIERLLSVGQTCPLQRRSLYAYLADALTAKARGDPVPNLTWRTWARALSRVGRGRRIPDRISAGVP
jgi:hypothetical protein